jgi:hypothetical protein
MPNKLLALAVLLPLTWALTAGLSALEVQRGKVKLSVNEKTGRYVVWGAEDLVKPVWTPLFVSTDPSTTKWKLLVGEKGAEKAFVLGDDPSFTTAVESTPTGAKVTWTGRALSTVLSFDFVLSANASAADGLRLALTVTNLAEATAKVGVRLVLDTNLGEKKDHFQLSNGDVVNGETKIDGALPDFWTSRSPADGTPGLLVMAGKGGTVPSHLVFANWKRLDDAAWDVAYKANRDFSLLPYSFNDSAVAQYYDPQDLAPGSSRTILVVLGLTSAPTLAGARLASANPLDDLLKKNVDPNLSALDQDLASLDTLLGQINAKLADPSHVGAEDLKLLLAALDQIEARRQALEASKP